MSLDKQRILSELGSVMNQLQSADCGCMGKLFSNGGNCGGAPMGNPLPTCGGCRRGSCPGHGHGIHYNNGGGDPYSMNAGGMYGGGMSGGGMPNGGMYGNNMHGGGMAAGGMHGGGMHGGGMQGSPMMGGNMDGSGMHGGDMGAGGMPGMNRGLPCSMGRHAPKLYADTYNYLNQNLMQPLVKEVYHDLSTITPANTIGNNPLAAKLGLPVAEGGNPAAAAAQGNVGAMGQMPAGGMGNPNTNSGAPNVMAGNVSAGGMGGRPDPAANMGGMGSEIVNMMMTGGGGKPAHMGGGAGGNPTNMANPGMPGQGGRLTEPMLIDAPHSPHGQVGVTPLSPAAGMQQGQMGQGNPGAMMQQPVTQYVTQDNMYHVAPPGNAMSAPQGGNGMSAPQGRNGMSAPQGNAMAGNMAPAQGNVNPMMAGRPGGSPNPYGQHAPGINKFKEMFPGVMQDNNLNFDPMAIAIQMNPANQKAAAMDTMTKLMSGNKGMAMTPPANNAAVNQPGSIPPNQQMAPGTQQNVSPMGQVPNQQMLQGQQQVVNPGSVIPPQQQQVYSATGAPVMNQQYLQQVPQQQVPQQQIDPNTGAPLSPIQEGEPTDAQMMQQNALAPGQAREPIHPVDTSNNNTVGYMMPQYTYNTLGQPIQPVNPNSYRTDEMPGLPQTLFGGLGRGGYGVKNTMSKTSLAGNRPLGTKASRSQLQHIYRQYRASQSATQQSIRPPAPVQGGSVSEGHLNTPAHPAYANPQGQQIPVEKVGGDTFANNPNVQMAKVEEARPGQVGDVPAPNTPKGDHPMEQYPRADIQGKGRNGLQDMTFTRYQASGAWSFHG